MSELDLSKTPLYDQMRRDGAKGLQRTLIQSHGQIIDSDIQRDLDQLMKEVATGIRLSRGTFKETAGLVRLVGYLQEMSKIIGRLPAFGFEFKADEMGNLTMVFHPKRLEHAPIAEQEEDPIKALATKLDGLQSNLGGLAAGLGAVR